MDWTMDMECKPAVAPKRKLPPGGRWRDLVVHCKRAQYDVYIGRKSGGAPAGATGEWGNPFAMTGGEGDRERVIEQYKQWLHSQPELCERARRELRGKVLGCWCAPKACHGHVLAEVANSAGPEDHPGQPTMIESAEQAEAKLKARKRLGKKLAEIAKLKHQQECGQQLQPNQRAKISQERHLRMELDSLVTGLRRSIPTTTVSDRDEFSAASTQDTVALVRTRSTEERVRRAQAEQHVAMEECAQAYISAQTTGVKSQIGTLQAEIAAAARRPTRQPPQQNVAVAVAAQPYDFYCVIDFEATCEEHKRIQPQEIIELPSVLLDGRTMSVVDEFQLYVRPVHRPRLTEFCTQLTGIQQAWVDEAPLFGEALQAHTDWLRSHGIAVEGESGRTMICVSCGDWDLKTMLPKQLHLEQYGGGAKHSRVPQHLRHWINIKHIYSRSMPQKATGMPSMLKGLGLTLEGRHHSGIDDCRNISKIVRSLAQRGVVLEQTGAAVGCEVARPNSQHKIKARASRTVTVKRGSVGTSGRSMDRRDRRHSRLQ